MMSGQALYRPEMAACLFFFAAQCRPNPDKWVFTKGSIMNSIKLTVVVVVVLLVVAGLIVVLGPGIAKTTLPEVTEANCRNKELVQSIQDLDARQKFREECYVLGDEIANRTYGHGSKKRKTQ
jgi:entry exclusion lipoprotein TrbK